VGLVKLNLEQWEIAMPRVFGVLVALTCFASSGVLAEEPFGGPVCKQAVSAVNVIADKNTTGCVVMSGGTEMLLLAEKRIPALEREGYLLTAVAAAGAAMNTAKRSAIRHVYIADRAMVRAGKVWRIDAASAARLQRDVKADRMDFEAFRVAVRAAAPLIDVQHMKVPAAP
jgi:hypothetical protein